MEERRGVQVHVCGGVATLQGQQQSRGVLASTPVCHIREARGLEKGCTLCVQKSKLRAAAQRAAATCKVQSVSEQRCSGCSCWPACPAATHRQQLGHGLSVQGSMAQSDSLRSASGAWPGRWGGEMEVRQGAIPS